MGYGQPLIKHNDKRPERHIGIVNLSWDVIQTGIKLPRGSHVLGIAIPVESSILHIMEVCIEHPDMPICQEGCRPLRIIPQVWRNKRGGLRVKQWKANHG